MGTPPLLSSLHPRPYSASPQAKSIEKAQGKGGAGGGPHRLPTRAGAGWEWWAVSALGKVNRLAQ